MIDLVTFIMFVLAGLGGFNPADIPETKAFVNKDGTAMTADEIEAACTGQSYDFWKAYATENEKQALEGGIQDFLGAN